jgi:HlyD family secretion protein
MTTNASAIEASIAEPRATDRGAASLAPSAKGRSRWWRIAVVAAVLGLGGAVLGIAWWRRGESVTTVVARRSDLEHRIVASGRVHTSAVISIATMTPGTVGTVGVAIGQHVKVGDLLLQLDDAEARAALAQYSAAVQQARSRAAQLRHVSAPLANEGLTAAQTSLDKAQLDLNRTAALVHSGAASATELEGAQVVRDLALTKRNAAASQQVAAAPQGADSRLALSAIAEAEAARKSAQLRLNQTRIVATSAGTVLSRQVEPGDAVQPGRTLLTVAVEAEPELTFNAEEKNLAHIALGQNALASTDAYPQEVFDAEVQYIAPSVDAQRGTVEIRLRVSKPPPYLRPEMTVSIDLLVASKHRVLVVPTEALRATATPSPWVLAVVDGKSLRKEVKLGIVGDETTEVLAGISDEEEIIVPDGHAVPSGRRVRATRKDR